MDFGDSLAALPFYLLLGLVCGLAAVGSAAGYCSTGPKISSRNCLWIDPWRAGDRSLGLGIIGYFVPRVLGVGYDTIGDILNATLAWKLLLVVMVAKAVALVISLGSVDVGRRCWRPCSCRALAMGGVFAMAGMDSDLPSANLSAGAFALVAMGRGPWGGFGRGYAFMFIGRKSPRRCNWGYVDAGRR